MTQTQNKNINALQDAEKLLAEIKKANTAFDKKMSAMAKSLKKEVDEIASGVKKADAELTKYERDASAKLDAMAKDVLSVK